MIFIKQQQQKRTSCTFSHVKLSRRMGLYWKEIQNYLFSGGVSYITSQSWPFSRQKTSKLHIEREFSG